MSDAPHWSEALPEPVKAHITNRGHDKEDAPTAAAKLAEAHFAAQRLIGVPPEQIVRLPKDSADPAYAEAYKRVASVGAHKEAAEYTLEGVPEATANQVRSMAVKLGLPAHVATEIAQSLVADRTAAEVAAAAESTAAVGAMQANLRASWGSNYDLNLFKVSKAAEALGWDKTVVDRMQGVVGGDKLMDAMLSLAGKMGEADVLRGGGAPSGPLSMTRDQALARKAEIMMSGRNRQFTPAEMEQNIKELRDLDTVIVGPAPAARW